MHLLVLIGDSIDPSQVRPGWAGGGIVYLLIIIVALLLWSFTRMVRKARAPWPDDDTAPGDEPVDGRDEPGADG